MSCGCLIKKQLNIGPCPGEVNLTVFEGLPLSSRPHLEQKPLLAPPSVGSEATKQRKSEAKSTSSTSDWKLLLPTMRSVQRGLNYKCSQSSIDPDMRTT